VTVSPEPLWRRHELETAAFEPRRIERSARRGSGPLVAWLGGLATLVAVAALGPPGSASSAARPSTERVAAGPAAEGTRSPLPERPVVAVTIAETRSLRPDGGGLARQIEVDGRLLVRAHRVRITLEGREDRIIRSIVRRTADEHGGIRPVEAPRFSAVFELGSRQDGGMWITVAAYDAQGARIGRVRQRIEVYPLASLTEGWTLLAGRHADPLAAPFRP
jgi:hypothetical protein